jgi:DNA-binding ferritin-like protein
MEPDRNDDHNVNFQVEIRSNIGLESDSRHSVVEILWIRLANEAGLSQKTRSAKWNGRGTDCL